MSPEMSPVQFEENVAELFNHEKSAFRMPAERRSQIAAAITRTSAGSRRGTKAVALAGAFVVLAIAAFSVTAAVLLIDTGSNSPPPIDNPGTAQEPGPPQPQVGEEPLIQDFGTTRSVAAHTFERAPAALDAAVGIMPYAVDLPTYLPGGLRVSHVGAMVAPDEPPNGTLSVAYTLPPDGTRRLSLQISWIYYGPDAAESDSLYDVPDGFEGKLPTPIPGNAFTAGGNEWRAFVLERSRGDTWEAVTLRDDGVRVFVDLRVADGLDRDETLAELQKVVESMGAGE